MNNCLPLPPVPYSVYKELLRRYNLLYAAWSALIANEATRNQAIRTRMKGNHNAKGYKWSAERRAAHSLAMKGNQRGKKTRADKSQGN